MQLSVVSTLFQSAPYIEEFYRRVRTEAEKIAPDAEFIFVNDGSTDRSLEVALELPRRLQEFPVRSVPQTTPV